MSRLQTKYDSLNPLVNIICICCDSTGHQVRMCGFWPLTYFSVLGDGAGVNLEDVQASLFIGQFNIYNRVNGVFLMIYSVCQRKPPSSYWSHTHCLTDFTVEPAGPQQGRVQSVGSVRGHDHLDSVKGVKAVHLVQQLTGREQDTTISHSSLNSAANPDAVSWSSKDDVGLRLSTGGPQTFDWVAALWAAPAPIIIGEKLPF